MPLTAKQAAKVMAQASGFSLSNLQYQKILYIAHLTYMYRCGSVEYPLISEAFEAWDYGPVVPSLYRELKCFGSGRVGNIFRTTRLADTTDREQRILRSAVAKFGKARPGYLVELTHRKGGAWEKHYQPKVRSLKIPNADIFEEAQTIYARTPSARTKRPD